MSNKTLVGFIINPIAGMGGAVGLKGTDGADILAEARRLGAEPRAPQRAALALQELKTVKDEVTLLTGPGSMGEDVARLSGLEFQVLDAPHEDSGPEDTCRLAELMAEARVSLLLFAGGDGTARDIHQAVGEQQVVLGIPAGVKIHSAVFGRNPALSGETAALWVKKSISGTMQAEVMDINEEDYRREVLSARLYGYLQIPAARKLLQRLKCGSPARETHAHEAIAHDMAEQMKPHHLYLVGAGSTTRALTNHLGLDASLLGVDAVLNGRIIGLDLSERQILELLTQREASLIVTPIGGQGVLLGRGNLQLSPAVLRQIPRERIYILATQAKINGLEGRPLYLDSGDTRLDQTLSGYYRIITCYHQHTIYQVES